MQKLIHKNLHGALEIQNSFIAFVCSILVFFVFLNTTFANVKAGFLERSKSYKPVETSSIAEVLSDLAAITKDNYDRIGTWQGTRQHVSMRVYQGVDVKDELQNADIKVSVIPQKLESIAEGTTKFVVDSKNNMIWSHMNFHAGRTYRNMDTKEICGTSPTLAYNTLIVTPDFSMRANPSLYKKDGTIAANEAWKFSTKGAEAAARGLGFNEDPRDLFKLIGPTWQCFSSFKEQIALSSSDPKLKMVKDAIVFEKIEDNSGLTYYIRTPMLDNTLDHIDSFCEITAPLTAGFNPTCIRILRAPEHTLQRQIDVEYTNVKDVYLPSKVHYADYDENGNIILEKKYTLMDMKINENIPENTFTESNLGLKEGDKLIDKRDEKNVKTFILKKENFIDVARPISENDKIASVTGNSDVILEIISTTPKLPAKLKTGNRLEMEVLYELPKNIQDAQIWVLPYTDSGLTPGSTVSHINFVENSSEGTVKSWFYFEQPMFVDEIRVFVGDKKGNIIQTKSVPVSLEWIK